jgi:hypothetical protein
MDGLFQEGGSVTVCAGFIPQRPEPAAGYRPTPRRFRQIQSPQDPLPSAAVDPFTRADPRGWVLHWMHSTRRSQPAQVIALPPNPTKGYRGVITDHHKTGTYGGIPTGALGSDSAPTAYGL